MMFPGKRYESAIQLSGGVRLTGAKEAAREVVEWRRNEAAGRMMLRVRIMNCLYEE